MRAYLSLSEYSRFSKDSGAILDLSCYENAQLFFGEKITTFS